MFALRLTLKYLYFMVTYNCTLWFFDQLCNIKQIRFACIDKLTKLFWYTILIWVARIRFTSNIYSYKISMSMVTKNPKKIRIRIRKADKYPISQKKKRMWIRRLSHSKINHLVFNKIIVYIMCIFEYNESCVFIVLLSK